MICYGMLGGFAFLVSVAVLESMAGSWRERPGVDDEDGEGDIRGQMWAVLADARKITEESS